MGLVKLRIDASTLHAQCTVTVPAIRKKYGFWYLPGKEDGAAEIGKEFMYENGERERGHSFVR
ncbi:uncharacterized protein EAE97_010867 [Botrytis byssoidea]|uniref:Uncharacterized protein n=1 Tax=Botrytis byssoidea TaxID=139641 RepID=A0A9P5LIX5_9HELO|nr:uncharacterized protein EAE97_010867 [Botrytis byssoidea]KAF7923429.1 hypothetical protein EAE97_010867 [Botrytis byssoidea]